MEETVYLDNSATTQVLPDVVDVVVEMMEKDYGNPSSYHRMGISVEKKMKEARQRVATALGAKAKEIIFTSGGTEANNLAIRGVAHHYRNRGQHLITSQIEHPSVLNVFKRLEKEGYQVTYLPVDKKGFVRVEDLKEAMTDKTILVSIMHLNNEVGSIQAIREMSEMVRANNSLTIFHVDAVQSFGKIPVNPREMGVDLLTISGHKIHGPKGVGALYCNEKISLQPLIEGGGQERDIRSGTENVPGIVGLGLAAQLIDEKRKQLVKELKELKGWLIKEVQDKIQDCKVNGPETIEAMEEGESSPHIINLSFPGLKGEVLLHALEDKKIYVSTGSACHSRQDAPSHVLQAMKLNKRELESAIRISLSYQTTAQDLEYLMDYLPNLVEDFRFFMKR